MAIINGKYVPDSSYGYGTTRPIFETGQRFDGVSDKLANAENAAFQFDNSDFSLDLTAPSTIDSTAFARGDNSGLSATGLSYDSALNAWSPEQWQNFGAQGGTIDANNNLVFGTGNLKTGADTGGGFMNFLGSDSAKNAIGIGGLAMSGLGVLNTYNAGKQAKKQWEAENARANEIMAMNREKYDTYKADRERISKAYGGN